MKVSDRYNTYLRHYERVKLKMSFFLRRFDLWPDVTRSDVDLGLKTIYKTIYKICNREISSRRIDWFCPRSSTTIRGRSLEGPFQLQPTTTTLPLAKVAKFGKRARVKGALSPPPPESGSDRIQRWVKKPITSVETLSMSFRYSPRAIVQFLLRAFCTISQDVQRGQYSVRRRLSWLQFSSTAVLVIVRSSGALSQLATNFGLRTAPRLSNHYQLSSPVTESWLIYHTHVGHGDIGVPTCRWRPAEVRHSPTEVRCR